MAGFLYLIWVRVTGLRVPCGFHEITGLKCPGCGITHMMTHLSEGAFTAAFWDNPFLFVTLPFVLAALGYGIWLREKGRRPGAVYTTSLWVYVALLVGFGVVRNLVGV